MRSILQDRSIVSAGDDRYWLDEGGYAAARKRRVSTVTWIALVLLLLAVLAVLAWLAPGLAHRG